jgi:hypothetical protein
MNAEDLLLLSAEAATNTVDTDRFVKLSVYALRLTGAEIGRHLQEEDDPGLFVPVDVVIDGKDCTGAILALGDRLIVSWVTGTLRIKNFEEVVPYDSIRQIERTARPGGAMTKDREVLSIEADRTWTLAFANVFEGGRSIVPYLQGTIDGAIKPFFEEQSPDEEKQHTEL